ncbi:hypothetical protein UlMin_019848 [Ulmus minor]
MMRSMLSDASLPKSFWGYALQTAAYLINRIPSKSIPKTPFELWTGHKPSLRHIRIWGCRAHVKKAKVDKLESRTEICKLQRSIYGLKQVSRSWNIRFDQTVKSFGFEQSIDEPCRFISVIYEHGDDGHQCDGNGGGEEKIGVEEVDQLKLGTSGCKLMVKNEKMETIGSETEAYAIADMIYYVRSEVYIVNCGMAFGQAALLLSLRAKGHRVVQSNSSTKLYLPKVDRSSGAVTDMWIEAKELDANTESYIDLLIAKEIQRPKYFQAQEAIEYGIVDKILNSRESAFEKRSYNQNYDEMLAQSRAMKKSAGGPPQASPFGFR